MWSKKLKMMTNLFSIFEPSSSLINLPLNWLSTFLGLMFIPYLFWISPSRWSLLWNKINLALHKEFSTILGPTQKSSTIIFVSLFSLIVFNNSLGLFPYIFTSSSHLAMTLALSLPLWLTFMIFGWVNHTQHMFAHLVPQGTPAVLMPFMVLIETISNIIRPGTLAVRLAANMMAGHLLLTLSGGTGPSLNSYLLTILIFSQILLLLLESAVAVIQSYVFAVLSTLFASEIN
uniref:ATP synthase subunit a n=2 Tax=Pagurus TaxID=6746 RepID=A0A2Z5V8D2_9EUCA|nr:ATP synthase protein 6 [Pagurus filholi]BBB16263.1 ATP synthase protein 6 [Pagurus japonicus]